MKPQTGVQCDVYNGPDQFMNVKTTDQDIIVEIGEVRPHQAPHKSPPHIDLPQTHRYPKCDVCFAQYHILSRGACVQCRKTDAAPTQANSLFCSAVLFCPDPTPRVSVHAESALLTDIFFR